VTSFSAATASKKTITYPKPLRIADVEAEGTASPRIRIPTSRTRSSFTAFTLLVRKATTSSSFVPTVVARSSARGGERILVHDDRIPSRLLRVAPKGAEGDRLLPKAERNFDRDEGIAREWYGEAGMDAFFRANQAVGGTVDRIAGASMGGSLSFLSRSLATQAQPERPAPPGAGLPRLVGRPRRLVIGPAAQRSLAKHFRPPKV
jgi:hypothetical protein